MDETDGTVPMTVGERLREAREAKSLSLEDVASSTRIPTRHLASLEASEWDNLPAATYSVGFRAPRGAELGAAFLDWLHERGLPDATYRDPRLLPTVRPSMRMKPVMMLPAKSFWIS